MRAFVKVVIDFGNVSVLKKSAAPLSLLLNE
jgi:hypothetical protein